MPVIEFSDNLPRSVSGRRQAESGEEFSSSTPLFHNIELKDSQVIETLFSCRHFIFDSTLISEQHNCLGAGIDSFYMELALFTGKKKPCFPIRIIQRNNLP